MTTYPTLERIGRARGLASRCADAMGQDNELAFARYWWMLDSKCTRASKRKLSAQRVTYFERLAEKRRVHVKMHRFISAPLRRKVLAEGEGMCRYCLYELARVVDHIIPVSRGGTNLEHNLAPACEWCNTQKLDMTPTEWKNERLRLGFSWPPSRDNDQLHIVALMKSR